MKKLTAEKCRELFLELFEEKRHGDGISLKEDLFMQALETAMPILERQEQESRCQQCGGTGWAVGNRAWGETVTVECDCKFEQQESEGATNENHSS